MRVRSMVKRQRAMRSHMRGGFPPPGRLAKGVHWILEAESIKLAKSINPNMIPMRIPMTESSSSTLNESADIDVPGAWSTAKRSRGSVCTPFNAIPPQDKTVGSSTKKLVTAARPSSDRNKETHRSLVCKKCCVEQVIT